MNRILIIGGSGLVGEYLVNYFGKNNYIGIIARHKDSLIKCNEFIEADTTKEGKWQERIKDYEIIINLVGANIGKRWTARYKKIIIDSRILSTRNIVSVLNRNQLFFSTSAVGYYGNCKDQNDFLSQVCKRWEEEAKVSSGRVAKLFIMRFGIVASENGGAFMRLIKNHKYLLGARIGDGNQYFSYIHIKDLAGAIDFLIRKLPDDEVFNFTSPNPVTNRDLVKAISKALNKPVILPPVPGCVLRLILGEFAETLLFSQRVIPKRLLNLNFEFNYPDINIVLKDITSRK